jgi:hypothetical protein
MQLLQPEEAIGKACWLEIVCPEARIVYQEHDTRELASGVRTKLVASFLYRITSTHCIDGASGAASSPETHQHVLIGCVRVNLLDFDRDRASTDCHFVIWRPLGSLADSSKCDPIGVAEGLESPICDSQSHSTSVSLTSIRLLVGDVHILRGAT